MVTNFHHFSEFAETGKHWNFYYITELLVLDFNIYNYHDVTQYVSVTLKTYQKNFTRKKMLLRSTLVDVASCRHSNKNCK